MPDLYFITGANGTGKSTVGLLPEWCERWLPKLYKKLS